MLLSGCATRAPGHRWPPAGAAPCAPESRSHLVEGPRQDAQLIPARHLDAVAIVAISDALTRLHHRLDGTYNAPGRKDAQSPMATRIAAPLDSQQFVDRGLEVGVQRCQQAVSHAHRLRKRATSRCSTIGARNSAVMSRTIITAGMTRR